MIHPTRVVRRSGSARSGAPATRGRHVKDSGVTAPGDRRAAGPSFAVLTRGGPFGREWSDWYAGSDRQHAEHLQRKLAVVTDTTTEVAWFALTRIDVQAAQADDAPEPGTPDHPRYAAILHADDARREPVVFSTHS